MDQKSILFMGTGDIGLPAFEALLHSEYNLIGLFTQPDRPVGRKQLLTPPTIKLVAQDHGIKIWQPERLRDSDSIHDVKKLAPDVIVVMAYGQILPASLLNAPKLACINLHASLLPKYRGASCIQGAIDAGDAETGLTVMHMAPALDEGDIILQSTIALDSSSTGGSVHDTMAEMAPDLLLRSLELLALGNAPRIAQNDSLSSYAPKLKRTDGEISWQSSAKEIERRVRAYDPWPGTTTVYTDEKGRVRRLKVFPSLNIVDRSPEDGAKPGEILDISQEGLIVACGYGAISIRSLQPEGGSKMNIQQFAHGATLKVGQQLGR